MRSGAVLPAPEVVGDLGKRSRQREADAPARLDHRPALDGLRGVAVLLVLTFHCWPEIAPGGLVGVDIFFVLSGFLITTLLLDEWRLTGRVSFPRFYGRRAHVHR